MKSQNSSSLVSVIIPTYNHAKFLKDAVESALSQTYRNIEVIVVNDGSTDNTKSVLEAFHGRITLIDQENLGVSQARNRGIQIAKGDFLAFLDSDDVWLPMKIEMQMEVMYRKPGIGCVYSGIEIVDESLNRITLLFPRYRGNLQPIYLKSPSTAVILLATSSALSRIEMVKKVGYFDRELSISADWDFFRRVSDVTEVDYVDIPLVKYRQVPISMSKTNISNYYQDSVRAYKKAIHDWTIDKRINKVHGRLLNGLLIMKIWFYKFREFTVKIALLKRSK